MEETNNALTTPLWGIWEFWCDVPPLQKDADNAEHTTASWLDSVKSFGVVDTVEGFWGIHECVLPPSDMPANVNYFLFRHNVAPLWEHEANRRGGKWVFNIVKPEMADGVWREMCIALIGESLNVSEEEICGCVVSRKRTGWKMSLWTRNADKAEDQMKVGEALKAICTRMIDHTDNRLQLSYVSHRLSVGKQAPHVLYTL